MLKLPSNKSIFNSLWTLSAIGLILVSLVPAIHQLLPSNFSTNPLQLANLQNYAKNLKEPAKDSLAESPFQDTVAIPNLVHFVHLVRPGPDLDFDFPFHQFIAIYSAYYYLRPDTIYIHTNIEEDRIEQILRNTTNPCTKAVSKLPVVQFKCHGVRNETSRGIPIPRLAHQSDFVRLEILKEYGGTYLDEDAYVLRDLRPLRRISFENIIGKQDDGDICNAVIMARRNSKMMTAYHILSDIVFDGSWTRHSAELLSMLAKEFAAIEYQVLVMPQDVFFPLSWLEPDLQTLYHIHDQPAQDAVYNVGIQNITAFVKNFSMKSPITWERDWRLTYVLHGWHSALVRNIGSKWQIADTFGKCGGITLEYVLARNSNFARAVYPAIKHAFDAGVLDGLKYDQSVEC